VQITYYFEGQMFPKIFSLRALNGTKLTYARSYAFRELSSEKKQTNKNKQNLLRDIKLIANGLLF